ncbi:adenosine receptor A2b-like [Oculina patagonica]
MDFNNWRPFWNMCFGSIALLTIVGNSLSISILLKRRLRKRCHYLLINLAIADLLVGLFAIPIYMITVMSEEKLVSRLVFDCVDMFTGFCSIFTLAVISLERLNAIARPLRHRQLSSNSYVIAMVTPWVLSFIFTSTRLLLGFSVMKIHQFVVVMIISLTTPLLVYCASHGVIWRKQASRLQNGVTARSEVKLSKTLLLITGTFVLTWLPFQVLVIVLNMCSPCKSVPAVVVYAIKLLQFGNSFSNCIIYCIRMQGYRNALFNILARCRCSFTSRRELYPLTDAPTGIRLVSFSSTLRLNNT